MRRHTSRLICIALLAMLASQCSPPTSAQGSAEVDKFKNPLLPSGPDPWVTSWKGFYYYMNTGKDSLTLRKTQDISDLRHAETKVVWTPEPGKPWSHETWAPELHRWGSKWYIYFAADDGRNASHRIYVVENSSDDPMQGEWAFKGKVSDSTDRWAIDATIFDVSGIHYMLWSGWPAEQGNEQDIYIARMSNPWTIDSPRKMISSPTYDWEKVNDEPNGPRVIVNEGPEALVHGDKLFVTYSASGCWTDSYALGLLQASTKADLLNPESWKKFDHPFFKQDADAGVYGTGHNGFFRSPDGKQDWIIYHANSAPGQGCRGGRSPRMQPFTWNADGTPNFGTPVPTNRLLDAPSR